MQCPLPWHQQVPCSVFRSDSYGGHKLLALTWGVRGQRRLLARLHSRRRAVSLEPQKTSRPSLGVDGWITQNKCAACVLTSTHATVIGSRQTASNGVGSCHIEQWHFSQPLFPLPTSNILLSQGPEDLYGGAMGTFYLAPALD